MSAYINIQCFMEYNKDTFSCLLKCFRMALKDLGFSERYTETYVNKVTWKLSDNGFMYTGCNMPSEKIKINEEHFYIRPLIIGFTSKGYKGLKGNWIEFAFLFDEDVVIKDYGTGEIYNNAKHPIWIACNVLSKHFPNTIVYLTDEEADALSWEALLGLCECLYKFDLAIVPSNYSKLYSQIPDNYKLIELNDKKYIVRLINWDNEEYII